jgi:hypothetical protein
MFFVYLIDLQCIKPKLPQRPKRLLPVFTPFLAMTKTHFARFTPLFRHDQNALCPFYPPFLDMTKTPFARFYPLFSHDQNVFFS